MQTFTFQWAMKILLALLVCSSSLGAQQLHPGSRTVMDAHNCYPYWEWWYDRIDRALSVGTPLAIEQDLAWYTDFKSDNKILVCAHPWCTAYWSRADHGALLFRSGQTDCRTGTSRGRSQPMAAHHVEPRLQGR